MNNKNIAYFIMLSCVMIECTYASASHDKNLEVRTERQQNVSEREITSFPNFTKIPLVGRYLKYFFAVKYEINQSDIDTNDQA